MEGYSNDEINKIREELLDDIILADKYGLDMEAKRYGYDEGHLISWREAKLFLKLLNKFKNEIK